MKSRVNLLLALILALTSAQPLAGQNPTQKPQQDEPKFRIGTSEVSLDVVVRDKKGRAVKDLKLADFEVYEDGARQNIESFRLVTRESGASTVAESKTTNAAGAEAPTRGGSTATPGLIALVFDRLTPDARGMARKAATAYADEGLRANDYAGVFAIDQSLITYQQYTDNSQLIRQAVEQATGRSSSSYVSNTGSVRTLSERSDSLNRQAEASQSAATAAGGSRDSGGAGAAGGASGQAIVEQAFVQMQMRMMETFEVLERNQQGYATINGLLALVNSMRNLPGRKTVIFFSEGLSLPPAVIEQFKSVISAANRAGVSVYAIDAAGLRIDSTNLETTREINSLAQRRMNQVHSSRDDLSGPMMKGLERNEDLLRLNPHAGLGDLADQTGGFLIRNTNDLTAGLRRIDEDMHTHYVLTYVPKNQDYDGRFRQISLKLAQPNLEIQTRKGYYAIDNSITSPVLNYEAPALAALSSMRGAGQFKLLASGLTFPEPERPGLTPIIVETPAAAFTYNPDSEKKTFNSDFTILVLVKNASKQVVEKLSQHYTLNGPIDKIEAAKKGEVLFYREADLPPGQYAIEAIAYDALSGKAGVRVANLELPEAEATKLRLSSLVLLKRADRLTAEEQKKRHPLHFGEVVVYPNLGEPLRKTTVKQLAFFFTAWPAKGATEKLKFVIEVLQNKQSLAQIPGELPEADQTGAVKYASALPLDKFPPGSYELRVTVKDGTSSVSRATQFIVEN